MGFQEWIKDYCEKWGINFDISPETKTLLATLMVTSFVAPIMTGLVVESVSNYLKKRKKK